MNFLMYFNKSQSEKDFFNYVVSFYKKKNFKFINMNVEDDDYGNKSFLIDEELKEMSGIIDKRWNFKYKNESLNTLKYYEFCKHYGIKIFNIKENNFVLYKNRGVDDYWKIGIFKKYDGKYFYCKTNGGSVSKFDEIALYSRYLEKYLEMSSDFIPCQFSNKDIIADFDCVILSSGCADQQSSW